MIRESIIKLKELISIQSDNVEKMMKNVITGLLKKDKNALENVLGVEEKTVNDYEIKIDEAITNIFALFQPEAKDLRTVFMISRMNIDLERIGDQCVNIAESSLFLIDKKEVKPLIDIPRMSEEALKMLHDSVSSFLNENAEIAKDVCKRDQMVDELNEQIFRELLTYMISNPKTIERSFHLIRISNNIEKIADLATNIAEEAVFISSGKIIKHNNPDN